MGVGLVPAQTRFELTKASAEKICPFSNCSVLLHFVMTVCWKASHDPGAAAVAITPTACGR